MKQTMRPKSGRVYRAVLSLLLCAAVFASSAGTAAAQQKDKKKKDAPAPDNTRVVPLADEQQIDYMISSMLGAWQVGDVDKLHESYGEDVVVVNGVWAPPTIGWANYAALYKQQRARMQQVRMDRSNTVIRVEGTVGWACYQWDFSATVDGQPSRAQGLTTLVVSKRNSHWVIVLNHTSLAQATPKNPGSTTPATQPSAKPESR
jgi:ketosteroid isomerase-like protein